MINPVDRLPLAFKAIRDFLIDFVVQRFALLVLLVVTAITFLWFASTRDFIISCQPFSTDPWVSCPLK
jgi:hypothetical protein